MSILSLGYLRLASPNLDAWGPFGADILGLMPADGPDAASRYFRWDKYPYRLQIVPAEAPGIEAVGYEVGDDRDLAATIAAVEAAGVTVERFSAEDSAHRLVSGGASFADPDGVTIELFYGPIMNHQPVNTPLVSSFVTGEMGMGHVVLNVDDIDAATNFYRDVLGFHRRNTWYFMDMAMAFFGCNPRHHTLAFGEGLPIPGKLIHFMVEAGSIDDVGYAQDRCVDAGVPVAMNMGRHTNDHMISFYCVTPDGFMVEFGWGGLHVEDPTNEATYQITKPSFWGHRPLKP